MNFSSIYAGVGVFNFLLHSFSESMISPLSRNVIDNHFQKCISNGRLFHTAHRTTGIGSEQSYA